MMTDTPAHDFKHVDRVRNWILLIAEKEGYRDLESAEIAALLHDIGRAKAKKVKSHGEVGAKMARKFLGKKEFPKEKIAEICHAIANHNSNRKVSGKLAHLLRDADMLDMFGAVGLMRAVVYKSFLPEYNPENVKGETWKFNQEDFNNKLYGKADIRKTIVDVINFHISCFGNLNTKTAKKLAKPLVKYLRDYVLQLEKEVLKSENIWHIN